MSAPSIDFGFEPPRFARRRRTGRAMAAAVVLAVVVLGAVGAYGHWSRSRAPAAQRQVLGAVAVDVPGDWRRTALSDDDADGRGLRAVFADPDDGRRLIVVVTGLQPGATLRSVAVSLRNRIAQRGGDRDGDAGVREFSAATRYAGRDVVSYREAPASGPAVHWYVQVIGDRQVSIGCQDGTGEAAVDGPCRGAVGSVRREAR
ncbi:MAG: type VII secretion-associated protein [Gordonia sp. (in: high G+C Gram-positive bacteria)]|uniref:type VII secretion-associated protein n=1 Tax=Gordonia sp. (in: high G+C Gram-positive bacteria) TaxID=84139 RepID=UPI0039E434DB